MARCLRRFVDLPLAGKLTIFATATSALSMAVICAILGGYNARLIRDDLIGDTARMLDGVSSTSGGTLAFLDDRVANETVHVVARDPQITTVAFVLRDGRVLARYDRDPARRTSALRFNRDALRTAQAWRIIDRNVLHMMQPVYFEGDLAGAIYVARDGSDVANAMARLWLIIALAGLATSMAAGLLAWRLQRIVSRPVLELAGVARRVAATGDLALRATKGGDDEIGELVDRFNEMLNNIEEHEDLLADYRQGLERMVETRTRELNARNERYRLLLESTRAVPWEIDAETFTISYIAPQITAMSGHNPTEIVGRSALDLVHPADRERIRAEVQRVIADPTGAFDAEYRHLTVRGDILHVRSIVSVDRRSDGSVVLRGIALDVTQQKRLEMELNQAQKLESVGRLAAGVAHEINTPLQFVNDSVRFVREAMDDVVGLIGSYRSYFTTSAATGVSRESVAALAAEEAERDIDYLIENMPPALDRSLEGLSRVTSIVQSMKEFAHPDQKEMAPVDLNHGILSTLTIARNEYKYVADLETDFGELPFVTCHGGDVNQVVLNLVINAAHSIKDAMAESGRKGRISVQTRREGDCVAVRIGDTGMGIPPAIREHVFDPFFTTKEVGRGTGQGLAIARSIVTEKHGGSLTFDTTVGRGTVFTIRLPIAGRRVAA